MNKVSDLHRNRLLASVDDATRAAIEPSLERVEMDVRDGVYRSDQPIEHVYFPLNCVLSMVGKVEGDNLVEVATVGNEGLAGIQVFFGTDVTPGDCFAQVPGTALRMTAGRFRDLVATPSAFTRLLLRYTQALLVQISQNAACNRAHPIDERCARWLLMTQDRVGVDAFFLTQQFLGQMLGARRAAVNAVMTLFSRAGIVDYARGNVRVLDRAALTDASCSCYGVIRGEYNRLLSLHD
jgi:hypothetical protein